MTEPNPTPRNSPPTDAFENEDESNVDAPTRNYFGEPFEPKTFGGALVWGKSAAYQTSVLRIREGEQVPVSTKQRKDMVVLLTGGRAILEIRNAEDSLEQEELLLLTPTRLTDDNNYRLIAMTEVELFTVFTPL